MKEYFLPEKYIKRVYNTDLTMSLIIITCSIISGLYKIDFTAVLMLVMGLLTLTMKSTRANNITYKILATDESIEFIAKKYTRIINFKDITRLSYKRRLFNNKSILGMLVFDKRYYGYIDLRVNNSSEIIENVLLHCNHLGIKELLGLQQEYKTTIAPEIHAQR